MFQGAVIIGLGPCLEKAKPLVCIQMCMCIYMLNGKNTGQKRMRGPGSEPSGKMLSTACFCHIMTVWKDFLIKFWDSWSSRERKVPA